MPIDPKQPDAFNCEQVPTLTQVINEIGQMRADQRQKEDGDSTTPPCLEPFMATFRDFLESARRQQLADLKTANRARAAGAAAQGNSMDF